MVVNNEGAALTESIVSAIVASIGDRLACTTGAPCITLWERKERNNVAAARDVCGLDL